MRRVNPLLLKDGYKVGHRFQYPKDTTMVYSNLTPRKSRRDDGGTEVLFFGLQYFVKEYLVDRFNEDFFARPRADVVAEYKRRIDNYLGPGAVAVDHIGDLHDLGYLPLKIKALPEGTLVPYNVPVLTIVNTHDDFFWLTNVLETLMSSVLWKASTSATTAFRFRQTFERYAERTHADRTMVPWQGHDFSMRGMCGVEDAALSGAAHLLSFTGTDTIPAIDLLENYYGADSDTELIGGSVAATEHSVMCMGEQTGELETFRRLITEVYPAGIVSIVSDTWDFWRVMTEFLPALKPEIMARDGKVVIRPDSGIPEKIILGDESARFPSPQRSGAVQVLWDTFAGELVQGYRRLDPHVGLIYGDGINRERQEKILFGLQARQFASTNVVLGLGSYTYQYVTRDTDGWAVKATAGRTRSRGLIAISKDPATDDGTKKSARGLLCVTRDADGRIVLEQGVTQEREREGLLEPVFENGTLLRFQALGEIRNRVEAQLASPGATAAPSWAGTDVRWASGQ